MNSGNVALQMQQQMHARHVALTLNPPEGARPHANAAHAHMNYVKMMLRTRGREGGTTEQNSAQETCDPFPRVSCKP